MSFEDLSQKFRQYFSQKSPKINRQKESFLKEEVLWKYRRERDKPLFSFYWWRWRFQGVAAMLLLGVGINYIVLPGFQNNVVAGTIDPQSGLIEVIREGKPFVVEDITEIQVGDMIRTGNKSLAMLHLRNGSVAQTDGRSDVKIQDKNALYLQQGVLLKAGKDITVATERGVIKAREKAEFLVAVSETGETRVASKKKPLEITNYYQESVKLPEGTTLTLKSDTRFLDLKPVPRDLALSKKQIKNIEGKLEITRSKLVAGIEDFTYGNYEKAENNFALAQKSYRSILQVLSADRQTHIAFRKNIEDISIAEVQIAVQEKTGERGLIEKIEATAAALTILEHNRGNFAFSPSGTDLTNFDRYAWVSYFADLGQEQQSQKAQKLSASYVAQTAREIYKMNESAEDYLSFVVRSVEEHELGAQFLQSLKPLLTEELQDLI